MQLEECKKEPVPSARASPHKQLRNPSGIAADGYEECGCLHEPTSAGYLHKWKGQIFKQMHLRESLGFVLVRDSLSQRMKMSVWR